MCVVLFTIDIHYIEVLTVATSVCLSVAGMMCAVLFSADQLFYRAEILNVVNAHCIGVLYVDYGNVEDVSVHRIRKLLDVYTVLTAQVNAVTIYACLIEM